jgi:N-acetylglutamate synthase-like GNAT family acetyltransferase
MIRKAKINDIESVFRLGDQFSKESKFVDYDKEIFKKNWTVFIEQDIGVIFISEMDNKTVGMIGGIKFSCVNTGKMIASELFWFVDPEYRGFEGIKLLKEFENWAKYDCDKITMVYLQDLMPDKVKGLYKKRGYELLETHYIKEF